MLTPSEPAWRRSACRSKSPYDPSGPAWIRGCLPGRFVSGSPKSSIRGEPAKPAAVRMWGLMYTFLFPFCLWFVWHSCCFETRWFYFFIYGQPGKLPKKWSSTYGPLGSLLAVVRHLEFQFLLNTFGESPTNSSPTDDKEFLPKQVKIFDSLSYHDFFSYLAYVFVMLSH